MIAQHPSKVWLKRYVYRISAVSWYIIINKSLRMSLEARKEIVGMAEDKDIKTDTTFYGRDS